MFPLLAPMISGGASLLGSIFSSQTSAQNTEEQMQNNLMMQQNSEQFNAQQAQMNRDYQTQMSNTAYQRASQDMQAAGLNPAMMFSSGGAESTPGGATASVGTGSAATPQRTSPFAGLGQAAASALDSMVKGKQIDLLTSEVAKNETDTKIREAGDYPEARSRGIAANYWNSFLENNPGAADVLSVGPHIGRAVDDTLKPGFDALQSVWGGLGGIAKKLFGSSAKSAPAVGEAAEDVAATSRGSSATAVRRGMDLERELQGMGFKSGPPEADRWYPGN